MKKITKILALTLALVMLALSCTSCGNLFDSTLFISDGEKEQMANAMRNETLFVIYHRDLENGDIGYASSVQYLKDDSHYWIDDYFIDEKKMSLKNYDITKEKYGTKREKVIELILPYEIESVDSNKANEIIISEDRKTVSVIHRHKDIDAPGDSADYKINDEIVIKYTK